MSVPEKIYILGCGAIGLTLAACLVREGGSVIAVRTSKMDVPAGEITVTVRSGEDAAIKVPVPAICLSNLSKIDGIVAVTAKSYGNRAIASALASKTVAGALVILQTASESRRRFLD